MRADSVELVVGDRVAPRAGTGALRAQRRGRQARRAREHLLDAREVLVLHALLGDDADRLRRFLQAQAEAGGRGAWPAGRVGAGAFRGARAFGLRRDAHFGQRGACRFRRRGRRCIAARRDDRQRAARRLCQCQPAARQRRLGTSPGHQRWRRADGAAALAGDARQHQAQFIGRQVPFHGTVGCGGSARGGGWCLRERCGAAACEQGGERQGGLASRQERAGLPAGR